MDKKEIYEKEMRKFSRTLKDILDMNRKKSGEVFEVKLYSPDCKVITDWFDSFDINSVPEKVCNELYRSYDDDYVFHRDWYDDDDTVESVLLEAREMNGNDTECRLLPVRDVVEHMTGIICDLKPEQFRTISINGIESVEIRDVPAFWVQPVAGYFPGTGHNIEIMDETMKSYGYVSVMKREMKDREGRSWFKIVYNPDPKFAKNVRDAMKGLRLSHYSPEFNHDSIMETGLVPSRGGRRYLYPDSRVFFYTYGGSIHNRFGRKFLEMMHSVSRFVKKREPSFSGIFREYVLDLEKVPEGARIFYDPNAQDCVYLNIHIEPEWIQYIRTGSMEF